VICLLNDVEPKEHAASQQQAAPRSLKAVVATFADSESRSGRVGN
jgi:hypothetical protein